MARVKGGRAALPVWDIQCVQEFNIFLALATQVVSLNFRKPENSVVPLKFSATSRIAAFICL